MQTPLFSWGGGPTTVTRKDFYTHTHTQTHTHTHTHITSYIVHTRTRGIARGINI